VKCKYTKDDHAKRIIKLLESPKACFKCPGQTTFGPNLYVAPRSIPSTITDEEEIPVSILPREVCLVCRTFVGLLFTDNCPCNALGKEEAVKRTWLALEEKGYI